MDIVQRTSNFVDSTTNSLHRTNPFRKGESADEIQLDAFQTKEALFAELNKRLFIFKVN